MTQLEALKVAYEELSSMMPDGENDEIFDRLKIWCMDENGKNDIHKRKTG